MNLCLWDDLAIRKVPVIVPSPTRARASAPRVQALEGEGSKVVQHVRMGEGASSSEACCEETPSPNLATLNDRLALSLKVRGRSNAHLIASMQALGFIAALLLASPVNAQTVEQFYRGRQVNLIVGFNPGGAYDPYARTVARHLPKHLPGSPDIVVKNMQGAGSVRAANYLYNVAPKDGSELGLIAGSAALEPMFGVRPTKFEGRKFTWLGSANDEPGVCFSWHTSPIVSAQDLFDKEMILGASGTSNLDFPLALNAVLGTKMRIVRGYNGTSSIMLAMERGEIQGMCGMVLAGMQTSHPDWLKDKKVRTLMQIGLEPNKAMTGIPFVMDLARSEDDRRVLRLLVGWTIMGRPYLAPPGVPDDRRTALRRAFDVTMKDPAFLADAAKVRLDISPIAGDAIDRFLQDVYSTPRPLVERAAKILAQGQ
jgi:tripartite-type tricarboxylate transporter receptor subunit TctC